MEPGHDPQLGVFGKHPVVGDFFKRGLDREPFDLLDTLLSDALEALQSAHPETWRDVFDKAGPVRFWSGLTGTGLPAMNGCIIPSRDRSGRRFPLMVVDQTGRRPPPTWVFDQDHYDALQTRLQDAAEIREGGVDAVLNVLMQPLDADLDVPSELAWSAPRGTQFWAVNDTMTADDLWEQAAVEDHRRCVSRRSYMWIAHRTEGAALIAQDGVPTGKALAWLWAQKPPEPVPDEHDEPLEENDDGDDGLETLGDAAEPERGEAL